MYVPGILYEQALATWEKGKKSPPFWLDDNRDLLIAFARCILLLQVSHERAAIQRAKYIHTTYSYTDRQTTLYGKSCR